MPTIQDFDADEEEAIGSSGGGVAAGGARQRSGAPTAQPEAAFTPWSRFVSANESVSNREAGELKSQVQGDVDRVTKTRDDAAGANTDAVMSNYAGYSRPGPKTGQAGTGAFVQSNSAPGGAFGASIDGPEQGATLSSWTPEPAPPPMRDRVRGMARPDARTRTQVPIANAGFLTGDVNPDKLGHDAATGKVGGVNLGGSPDLRSRLGADAWSKLVGDTQRAQSEADALGSEEGVQALLQQQASAPMAQGGAFDAALIGGAGGQDFRDIAKRSGGDALTKALMGADQTASNQWAKLMGDVGRASGERQRLIDEATAAGRQAEAGAAESGTPQQQAEEQLAWLQSKFPVPNGWGDPATGQESFIEWLSQNRTSNNGTNNSAAKAWADQIYGPDASGEFANLDKLYADVRKMTPLEYQAFLYGIVPPWMGMGAAASVANGGAFGGLGNTGDRVTGVTTNDPTDEHAKDWNEKQAALQTLTQIMAAIAAGG